MAKRVKQFRDSDWDDHKVEDKHRSKKKEQKRSSDRKHKLSDKRQFIS